MRKAAKQLLVCALLLLAVCLVCRIAFFRDYDLWVPLNDREEEALARGTLTVTAASPEIVDLGEIRHQGHALRIRVQPRGPGEGDIVIGEPGEDGFRSMYILRVGRLRTVYNANTGGFTGDTLALFAITVLWLLMSAIMLWHYTRAKGPAFYAYGTIYYAGFSLFALISGLTMLTVAVRHLVDPAGYPMFSAYGAISRASGHFMVLTAPLTVCFALAMAVSNLALLRHERPRVQNALGLGIALLLLAGEAVGWLVYFRDFSGSEWEGRIMTALENTYTTIFVYCQCMLMGAVICGIRAARHQPSQDKDFILILGCWFRPDGSLPPLLRGRVDRAVAFWRAQREATGREACFIPSGGQGPDEPMPEAEAMRRYLLAQGIPDRLILPEARSGSTFENMAFSRELIQQVDPAGKAAFSTTNYHVFRSGVWANLAGLPAEGMGSRTKWWFWPNAFVRETAGLLQKRWKQELLLLFALLAFFILLTLLLG